MIARLSTAWRASEHRVLAGFHASLLSASMRRAFCDVCELRTARAHDLATTDNGHHLAPQAYSVVNEHRRPMFGTTDRQCRLFTPGGGSTRVRSRHVGHFVVRARWPGVAAHSSK